MTVEQLRSVYRANPFRPFVIRLVDGRSFPVSHPDFLSLSPSGSTVVIYGPAEELSILDLLLMTEIELSAWPNTAA